MAIKPARCPKVRPITVIAYEMIAYRSQSRLVLLKCSLARTDLRRLRLSDQTPCNKAFLDLGEKRVVPRRWKVHVAASPEFQVFREECSGA